MSETAQSTDGPIVLYDGVCGLCNRSVQTILRNDRRGRFRFAAIQSEAGERLLRQHGLPTAADADGLQTVVLIDGGKAYTRSRAALGIARRLDAPWPMFWPLVVVPRAVSDFFYDFVARNRYRWFGKYDACQIPAPEVRARFLS